VKGKEESIALSTRFNSAEIVNRVDSAHIVNVLQLKKLSRVLGTICSARTISMFLLSTSQVFSWSWMHA
jgi:hypothetical protein